jgi:hypothetical protein
MLRGSTHAWKVNFCSSGASATVMEDASANSGVKFLAH